MTPRLLANVYRFFDSKKDINESVALRLMGEVEQACRDIAAGSSSASWRLENVLLTIHKMNGERYIQDVQMHEMVASAMRDSWPIVKQHILNIDQIVAGLLKEGMASGEFVEGDVEITARCICTAMMRFSHPGMMLECREMELPTPEHMTKFVLAALSPKL
jgi:AcrR family transcriptional regulator